MKTEYTKALEASFDRPAYADYTPFFQCGPDSKGLTITFHKHPRLEQHREHCLIPFVALFEQNDKTWWEETNINALELTVSICGGKKV